MQIISIKVITTQPTSSIGHASSSSSGNTSLTISSADCAKAKEYCTKAAKIGGMAACFGAGYAARSLYDSFTGGSGASKKDDDYTTSTTRDPFRVSDGSLGNWSDDFLDRLNGGKIY